MAERKARAPKKRKKAVKAGSNKGAAAHKRQLFIEAMLANGGNATQAAIAAGYSEKTAKQAGSRLLTHADVRQVLAEKRAEALTAAHLTVERTLQFVARVAFFDPRRLYDEHGNLKPVHELDEDTATALAGVDLFEEFDGKGDRRKLIGYTKKVRLADRVAALNMAMKHLGQFAKDNGQLGKAIGRAIVVPAKQSAG